MDTNCPSAPCRFLMAALVALASFSLASAQGQDSTEPQSADRWIIRFESGAFSLMSRSATTKVLPASDELPAVQLPLSGFWFELHAADGSVRYRRIVGDPVRLVFEGPARGDAMSAVDPGPSIARSAGATRHGGGAGVDRGRRPASDETRRAELERLSTPVRDEAIPDERVFTLLTPAASEGESLVLFSSPLEPNSQGEPATQVAEFTVGPDIPQQ